VEAKEQRLYYKHQPINAVCSKGTFSFWKKYETRT